MNFKYLYIDDKKNRKKELKSKNAKGHRNIKI